MSFIKLVGLVADSFSPSNTHEHTAHYSNESKAISLFLASFFPSLFCHYNW